MPLADPYKTPLEQWGLREDPTELKALAHSYRGTQLRSSEQFGTGLGPK